MVLNQVYEKAEIVANEIIIVRKWVADMRGVYVIERDNIRPNKFLPYPTLSCGDITLVLRNPALVTKEISEINKNLKSYFFRLTSNKIINPQNAPDLTEKKALRLFKLKKIKEFTSIENKNGQRYFRLIKPLFIKSSCLTCHIYQGYEVGQLRGALSIFMPMDCIYKDLNKIKLTFIISALLIVFLTTIIVYFVEYYLTIKPIVNLTKSTIKFRDKMEIDFLPSHRKDEIGILENSFFEMANKIKFNYSIMKKEIEKATEELKRKDKLKTDFLATVSHELRTPLTTIQGGIEYLSKVIKKKENVEFIEIIDKNIKNLILMVNNLIDIARIEIGKLELDIKNENIKEILEEIIIFFKGYAGEKNIKIEKRNFEKNVFINIDRKRINQVFINILHNAIKFSPKNSKITISINETDNFVEIYFINKTIENVNEKDLSKFFLKYKHLKSAKEKGSGLGLAIARGIMLAHKGDIEVRIINSNTIEFKVFFLKNINNEVQNE